MNREIIFRGKRDKTGEWVEGYLIKRDEPFLHDIVIPVGNTSQVSYAIIRGTVGQYTGLDDCTGKRIFEGDILEFEDLGEEGYEYKEGFDFINTASVVFNNGRFKLENFGSDNSGVLEEMNDDHEDFIDVFAYSTIIGNRWDNPELLVAE